MLCGNLVSAFTFAAVLSACAPPTRPAPAAPEAPINVVHPPGAGACAVGELQFSFRFQRGATALANERYTLLLGGDQIVSGVTDAQGGMRVCNVEEAGDYCISVGGHYTHAYVTQVKAPSEEQLTLEVGDVSKYQPEHTLDVHQFKLRCGGISAGEAEEQE